MKKLELRGNQIKNPSFMKYFTELKIVDLSYNEIELIEKDVFISKKLEWKLEKEIGQLYSQSS